MHAEEEDKHALATSQVHNEVVTFIPFTFMHLIT